MQINEANIREYMRTHEGFRSMPSFSRYHPEKIEVSVETLLDMTNFFAKLAADQVVDQLQGEYRD